MAFSVYYIYNIQYLNINYLYVLGSYIKMKKASIFIYMTLIIHIHYPMAYEYAEAACSIPPLTQEDIICDKIHIGSFLFLGGLWVI